MRKRSTKNAPNLPSSQGRKLSQISERRKMKQPQQKLPLYGVPLPRIVWYLAAVGGISGQCAFRSPPRTITLILAPLCWPSSALSTQMPPSKPSHLFSAYASSTNDWTWLRNYVPSFQNHWASIHKCLPMVTHGFARMSLTKLIPMSPWHSLNEPNRSRSYSSSPGRATLSLQVFVEPGPVCLLSHVLIPYNEPLCLP